MNEIDEVEEVEKLIVLLLGSERKEIDEIFLQKELFILSNVNESLKNIFNFKKHYKGPYSDIIHSSLDSPVYLENAFTLTDSKVVLNKGGEREFETLLKEEKYRYLLPVVSFIRSIYERLSYEELLFLIYATYPSYTDNSNIHEILFNKVNKERILNNLIVKKIITLERYKEIKNND